MPIPDILIDWSYDKRRTKIIFDLFITPADDDYLSARMSYLNGLHRNFYWSASQAIEKYLKAIMLFNEKSTKTYNHNLEKLFIDFTEMDNYTTLPEFIVLTDKHTFDSPNWENSSFFNFIEHLQLYGSTDNRYGIFGEDISGNILQILDTVCHKLRIYIRNNNFLDEDIFEIESVDLFNYDKISYPKEWMLSPTLRLERLYNNKLRQVGEKKYLRKVFKEGNWAFFKIDRRQKRPFNGLIYKGSPVHNHIIRLKKLDKRPANIKNMEKIECWINENITITGKTKNIIKSFEN